MKKILICLLLCVGMSIKANAQGSVDSLSITMSNDTVFVECTYQSSIPNIIYFKCSPNGFNGPSVYSPFFGQTPGMYKTQIIFTNLTLGASYCVRAVLTDTVGASSISGGQVITTHDACLPVTTGLETFEEKPEYVISNGMIQTERNTFIEVFTISGQVVKTGTSQVSLEGLKGLCIVRLTDSKGLISIYKLYSNRS